MRHPLPLAPLLCLVLSACSQSPPNNPEEAAEAGRPVEPAAAGETTSTDAAVVVDVGELQVGPPLRQGNLTVFPVLSRSPREVDRFITLEEGLKAGTVEIRELGAAAEGQEAANAEPLAPANAEAEENPDEALQVAGNPFGGGEVNRLAVVNRSEKPLYLMPGEVIVGGSQDRTIAEELVLAPTGEPIPIDAYCVEHGRWGQRSVEESEALLGAIADAPEQAGQLAAKAGEGKFAASAGYLNKKSRVAAQAGHGQQAVWDEVAKTNSRSKVMTATTAFTANYADEKVADGLGPYVEALSQPVAEQAKVIGAIVAVNGKVESVDVFGSTPLFRKLWPKLLKSHALDALHAADDEGADKESTAADAAAFLEEVLQAQVDEIKQQEGGLVVTKRDSERVVRFAAGTAEPSDAAQGGFGYGGAVHTSGFAK